MKSLYIFLIKERYNKFSNKMNPLKVDKKSHCIEWSKWILLQVSKVVLVLSYISALIALIYLGDKFEFHDIKFVLLSFFSPIPSTFYWIAIGFMAENYMMFNIVYGIMLISFIVCCSLKTQEQNIYSKKTLGLLKFVYLIYCFGWLIAHFGIISSIVVSDTDTCFENLNCTNATNSACYELEEFHTAISMVLIFGFSGISTAIKYPTYRDSCPDANMYPIYAIFFTMTLWGILYTYLLVWLLYYLCEQYVSRIVVDYRKKKIELSTDIGPIQTFDVMHQSDLDMCSDSYI